MKRSTFKILFYIKRSDPKQKRNTQFLRNTHKLEDNHFMTKKSGNNNAMKTMQHLRVVFNYIKNSGEVFADPFADFKMKFENNERDYLEQEELSLLQNKTFGSERLERVRDIFLFSCYTGLSFCDPSYIRNSLFNNGYAY